MGELVVGRPTPRQLFAVSAPLELTSAISLAFRAGISQDNGEASQFDPWVTDAWQALDDGLRHDLSLLLGFSGRQINYIEELLFSFDPLDPDRLEAPFSEYLDHLASLPPEVFQRMAAQSVVRVYQARGVTEIAPEGDDPGEWRMFLRPGIVRADLDEAASLVTSPQQLKQRTLALLDGFWFSCFGGEYERRLPELHRALRAARTRQHPTIDVTFSELTEQQLPDEIAVGLPDVRRVTYCPSPYLGSFVQYILYEPELILYFNSGCVLAPEPDGRRTPAESEAALASTDVLEGLKALADPSRMRIVEMLRDREMYAQEIVGQLRISQSAVSRHLGTLESAGIVNVRPANGMKYYSVDRDHLQALARHLDAIAELAVSR